jgi:hypothetical protein
MATVREPNEGLVEIESRNVVIRLSDGLSSGPIFTETNGNPIPIRPGWTRFLRNPHSYLDGPDS